MDQHFDVFVSYSSKEKAIADAVVAAHEQAGIRCWYAPRDIKPGADWADSITKAIHECSIMVLIFSKEANRSQRVIDEVNYAISQEKPLLPFRVESSTPTGALSLHLSSRHWLDAYEPGWEEHLERLVKSVALNLEGASETIQISGRSAVPVVGKAGGRNPLKTVGYLVAGLIVISAIGYFGWGALGRGQGDPSPGITQTTPTVMVTPEPIEVSVVEPTPIPQITGVLRASIQEQERGWGLDPSDIEATVELTTNLFLGLTKFDFDLAAVVPAAAESWTVSPDGSIYTFRLRGDIPWVDHSLGGETTQVINGQGDPRYLTAEDFEYSFKRHCDPRLNNYFLLTNVEGCTEVYEYEDPENLPLELLDQIGVEAVSDTELIIRLAAPSASFLTKTANPVLSAVPAWAMDKYGEAWTNPGLIFTNGSFVIDEWIAGESIHLIRNELLPVEMGGDGNIQTVQLTVVENDNEAYQMWIDNQLDYAIVEEELLPTHLEGYPENTFETSDQVVYYAVFNQKKAPFNNIHLRRAFSAAVDRSALLSDILEIGGIPMIHLAPPGVFGAPPIAEVGLGYDLDYARAELEQAGYPGCQGLPQINYYALSGLAAQHGKEITRFWENALGCPEGSIQYQGRIILEEEAE
jgi:ABC-type transport system substrate-binding protein